MDYRYFLYCIHFIEFITAIIAIITWKKYRYSTETNFVYYFCALFIIDTFGSAFGKLSGLSNYWIYNSLMILQFSFLLKWYYNILGKSRILISCFILYTCMVIISFMKENFFHSYQTMNFISGVSVILISSLLFYLKLLNSNEILSLKTNLRFWITIGNIIFFVGILPLMIMHNYMNIDFLSYMIVLTLLNWITYSCYILGFIWMKKK